MTTNIESRQVPGIDALIAWFGYLPSFHDAEVISILLRRSGQSCIVVHAFESVFPTEDKSVTVYEKHILVTFVIEGIVDATIEDFNLQNVLGGLYLNQTPEGYQLILEGSYGANGTINAARISIQLEPGIPTDSQYLKLPHSD